MTKLKIALLQINPAGTFSGNLEKGAAACRKARSLGADIALFPEMFSIGYDIYGRPAEDEGLRKYARSRNLQLSRQRSRLQRSLDSL